MAAEPRRSRRRQHYSVYVVQLSEAVLRSKKFRAANPDHDPLLPCLYVGMTGLPPTERLANHLGGIKANRFVTRYGLRLLPQLYESYNPMGYKEALERERLLAELLRRQGFAVWQH